MSKKQIGRRGGGVYLIHIIEAAREQGWTVEPTRKSHVRFVPPEPDRSIVICSSTPRSPWAIRDAIRELKRSGLEWPVGSK